MRQVRVIVAGLALAVMVSAWAGVGTVSAFTDVPDSHRYARAVNELAQLGIVSGKDDGAFRPDDPVCRAQFAKMMCGLLKIDVSEDQGFAPFVDLGPDDLGDLYPHEFVGAAYQAGITKGKTATTFSPYAHITLAQVTTTVIRAADAYHPGLLASPPGDWWGLWPDTDRVHGANLRRADYTDLLAHIPIEDPQPNVSRPATRGEVCQILVNLRTKLAGPGIALSFDGHTLALEHPIYVKENRYYVPFLDVVQSIGGTTATSNGKASGEVSGTVFSIDTTTGDYTTNGKQSHLKQKATISDGAVYVSLFDLQKMLKLKLNWDEDGGIISIFWNRDTAVADKEPLGGRTALIRFEDITSEQRYSSAESLEKLRVVFDYCYARGIPMQFGWVPRYIDPGNGIDNAPAEDYSMHNADFIYTLDYFTDRKGLVGLHGYTHQCGHQVSLDGTEFDKYHNTTESGIRKRLECAINDASSIGIPISFFESPHYAALGYQKAIIAQYFDILYEYRWVPSEKSISKVTVGIRTIKYIPTPLGYIDGITRTTDTMLAQIAALRADELGSFFYHPDFEFAYIRSQADPDGYPSYEYAPGSPLHRIVDAFIARGYTFVGIDFL